jgi:tetratricopeptide (TPR) repeat protein
VPAAWYGLVFFLAALAITSNVLLPIGTIEAERLVYLPALGFCLAVAGLAGVATDRVGVRTIAVVVLALGVRTWIRNADWRDDYHLFTATAVTSPNSARAQSNAGAVYAQHGEFDEALLHYETATRIRPTFVPAQIGVGRLLAMQGRSAEALAAFDRARHGDTPSVEAHLLAGDLRLELGDAAGAETTYRDGLSASPADPDLRLGVATAIAALGRRDEAIAIRDDVERDAGAAITARVAPRLAALEAALAR